MDEDTELRLRIAVQVLGLAYSIWMIWTLIVPPHQRQLLKMRALRAAQAMTAGSARRAGAASMAAELATGEENYALPYALSLARERLARGYDRIRGITS